MTQQSNAPPQTAPIAQASSVSPFWRWGRVDRVEDDGTLRLTLDGGQTVTAEPACDLGRAPVGHRAVTLLSPTGEAVVIALAGSRPDAEPEPVPQVVTAGDGSSAALVRTPAGECLEIRDPDGQVLVRHETATGRTHLVSVPGDLDLVSLKGRVRIQAGRSVEVAAPRIRLAGEEAELDVERARLRASEAVAETRSAQVLTDRLTVVACTAIQRTQDLYRSVAGLFQSNAGRVKTVVEDSYDLKAKQTYIRADDQVRLLGDKIHLG